MSKARARGGQIGFYLRRGLDLLWRRATASRRVLPDHFILGATKCGTTSLAHYLSLHPACLPAYTKELMFLQELPHFVSNHERQRLVRWAWGSYQDDLISYRKFFPLRSQMLSVKRDLGVLARTGDHTPFYLYCPVATRRISEMAPSARLIVLLRDPVARTYSDYNMLRERNPRENRTFEQAVEDEWSGACRDFRLTYLHQSLYEPHVRRWLTTFSSNQLLILDSRDLFRDKEATLHRVFEFLDLSPHLPGELPVKNRGRYREPMDAAMENRLREYFRPHNQRLYELLGRNFGWDS